MSEEIYTIVNDLNLDFFYLSLDKHKKKFCVLTDINYIILVSSVIVVCTLTFTSITCDLCMKNILSSFVLGLLLSVFFLLFRTESFERKKNICIEVSDLVYTRMKNNNICYNEVEKIIETYKSKDILTQRN